MACMVLSGLTTLVNRSSDFITALPERMWISIPQKFPDNEGLVPLKTAFSVGGFAGTIAVVRHTGALL
jgi:hypothetical protein